MAKPNTNTRPFAWLGRYWVPVGLGLVLATAAVFRFLRLDSLPPGLDETSARIGLQAQNLGSTHWIPVLNSDNGYAPLWVWLQSASVHIFGHTAVALRLWPALLGVLTVLVVWLWLRDWFGTRVAWVGSVTLAVSPWAVTLSRTGSEAALIPLLVALTLWTGGLAWRTPSRLHYLALGAVLALNLLSGPLGWLLTLATGVTGLWQVIRHGGLKQLTTPSRLIGGGAVVAGLALLAYFVGASFAAVKALPSALGLATSLGAFSQNFVKVMLMFNVHGDENYRHNLAGEPLLNAFMGLMLIAGLLVAISRLHQLRYRILLLMSIIMLIPALITTIGAPNANRAAGVMPLIFALVGIGTSYMLELWYATFPINSAARATGQAAIILLLALSVVQGYTQYFVAWGESTAVYVAHNEGATLMAGHVRDEKFAGKRFVIVPAEQMPTVRYLAFGTDVHVLTPAELNALPITPGPRQFYIGAASRDEAVKILKAKYPGGVLRPHYSPFNLVEIYYTYEVTK